MSVLSILITIIVAPLLPLYILYVLAFAAEYFGNPVIELVKELRKKHSNTNEN